MHPEMQMTGPEVTLLTSITPGYHTSLTIGPGALKPAARALR
jgi:hypothetical protein